jgi:hypothetical protein
VAESAPEPAPESAPEPPAHHPAPLPLPDETAAEEVSSLDLGGGEDGTETQPD